MTTVFDGAGRMQSSSSGAAGNVLTTSGDFSGQFSRPCPGTTSSRSACLDFSQYFSELFAVVEGELFEVELILWTHAAGIIAGGEANATADFYNSGGFELSTGEIGGLRLVQTFETPVGAPEPGTLSLLAAGLLALGLMQRRIAV